MSRPSKPMAKDSNSKFTPRNNKRDIFSKLAKTAKPGAGMSKRTNTPDKSSEDSDGE